MSSGKTDTVEINEDVEKYYWTPRSSVPLDEFLNKVCLMARVELY
jgi:hypothetical protein